MKIIVFLILSIFTISFAMAFETKTLAMLSSKPLYELNSKDLDSKIREYIKDKENILSIQRNISQLINQFQNIKK